MSISRQRRSSPPAVFLIVVASLMMACGRRPKTDTGPPLKTSVVEAPDEREPGSESDSSPEKHVLAPLEGSDHASVTDPLQHADHAMQPAGQMLMQGNYHVEVVLDGTGNHRAYVADIQRKPIAPTRIRGHLTISRPGTPAEHLVFAPEGDHLAANGRSLTGSAKAKIELNLGGRTPLVAELKFPVPQHE